MKLLGAASLILLTGMDGGSTYCAKWADAEPAYSMDGGVFLPAKRAEFVSCELAACRTERDELRERPIDTPVWVSVAGLVLSAAATGVTLYLAVRKK